MKSLTEESSILLSRLPMINNINELLELSCSLLNASAYVVEGSGRILVHSDTKNVTCEAWGHAITIGYLSEAHKKTVLTPEINCNVIRDSRCRSKPCARLSIPIKLGEDVLPGSVVFFLWDNDPSYEKQTLACVLAGAVSNLLQKNKKEGTGLQTDSLRILTDLLNYKPGLRLYFFNALKTSEFSGMDCSYRLCLLSPSGEPLPDGTGILSAINALPGKHWAFAHDGRLLLLYAVKNSSDHSFREQLEPFAAQNDLRVCAGVCFDELIKLRYIYEDTLAAFELASRRAPDTLWLESQEYLSYVFLKRCREKLAFDELYPDFFRKLIEYDEKTGKDYLRTLAAYLDNGRNTNAAAKQIFMHRNTMVQQLERIEQLMGVSLDDSEMCFYLQLCLHMNELD